ncbi:hypothetical protein PoB_002187500 [Plakobranchus ocellatus]|uniref:Uncharacterized protein n=1 Tax=Plakobranchus ocellatus TaxID=259542 RepID=A0AAV3ZJQ0_9GAST|nr:hypothetical protein PoB_002187500 [Plakobranchus ocellatus]
MAEARCDTVAEAMEAEFSPEATDPIVRNFDLYLSTAATLTEAEAMEAQQAERRLPTKRLLGETPHRQDEEATLMSQIRYEPLPQVFVTANANLRCLYELCAPSNDWVGMFKGSPSLRGAEKACI